MKPRPHSARDGFSLVLSLIILTLLAILVVGFLSSTAMDRTTAHAFAGKAVAETAADAAVNQAMSTLREYIAQYPDSVTMWEKLTPSGGGPAVEGTMLYYNDQPPQNGSDPSSGNTTSKRYILPLVSLGVDANGQPVGPVELKDKAKALGTAAWREAFSKDDKTEPNCIDLNRPQFNGDTAGWIGAAPDGRRPFYAKWIEVKDNSLSTPKTIGRYAYWVEDESFKLNLNSLDNNLSNTSATTAGRGLETAESKRLDPTAPLAPQIAGLVPIQGVLRNAGATTGLAQNIFATRASLYGKRLPDLRSFNQADSTYPIGDATKFLATAFSGGLNLSRHGSQRVNLNGLGFEKQLTDPTLNDDAINKQLRQVVETIKYHAPLFGQRFYRSSTSSSPAILNDVKNSVTSAHSDIYDYKIAANIRDYIDPDSQPTLITNTGTFARGIPTRVIAMSSTANKTPNDYWAQGKDGAPFLQEAVVRFRSHCDNATKRYDLKVDYYIEFWNMTDQDVYAAPQKLSDGSLDPKKRHLDNAFVAIADPVPWVGHGAGNPSLRADNSPPGNPEEDRDLIINLSTGVFHPAAIGNAGTPATEGVIFKAGVCTVITTDPDDLPPLLPTSDKHADASTTGGINKTNTYYCSKLTGKRYFEGPVGNPSDLATKKCDGIWAQFRDAPSTSSDGTTKYLSDYGTEVILANSFGYIDSNPYVIAQSNSGPGPYVTYLSPGTPGNPQKTARDDTAGGSLMGNTNTPSQLGDPRTNNEQLYFTRYIPRAGGPLEYDQTRYFNPSDERYRFSLGWPNSRYFAPAQSPYPWKDYYKVWTQTSPDTPNDGAPSPTADTAPAVIANENLKSIGQLGDIFDPARMPGVGALGITGSRGGGRTFKIGQKDDLVDMSTLTAASQQWASWRLTDFFGISNDIFQPGLININGLLRDKGAALRAACEGLILRSVSQATTAANPAIANVTLDSGNDNSKPGLQRLIDQAIKRLSDLDPAVPGFDSKLGYFRERGELSELDIFSAATTKDSDSGRFLPGVSMSVAFDRTREELVRRLIDLITTRGSVFSVYAVGQSITEGNDAAKTMHVTGEHRVKVTFALVPRKADGSDFQVKTEDFDPTDSQARLKRFAKPDHYDIQYLQVSSL